MAGGRKMEAWGERSGLRGLAAVLGFVAAALMLPVPHARAGSVLLPALLIAASAFLGFRQIRARRLLGDATAARTIAEAARALAEAELRLVQQREQTERALRQHYLRFGTALDYMSQGLCMFDEADRVLVANGRLAAMLGVPASTLRPGTTLDAIMREAVARGGIAPADAEKLLAETVRLRAAGAASSFSWPVADGRVFAVNHQPTAEQGWLATYEDVTERRRAEARIAHMAHHDGLTNLPNRVLFRTRLEEAVDAAGAGEAIAVLCLDLDHFKAVNDTLGHPVGDALLRAVTERLRGCVREADTVARLGGDEFALVQRFVPQPAGAAGLAGRLVEVLSAPYELDGHHIVIGTSIGVSLAPADGTTPDQLLRNADMALYRAKLDGRGRWRFFEPEMDQRMQTRRTLELALRRGLALGEFELHYQPLVRLNTGRISGFEALLRWHDPERGLVPPADFIPLAEEIGLIVPLGEWVLRTACAQAATWPGDVKVAVNLSPVQVKSRQLVPVVIAALRDSGLDPHRLELEITEGVLLHDTAGVLTTLHELRALGVTISMDDFGTGYSSLGYLRKFPFDKIKIDRSFVGDLGDKAADCLAIVRAVTGLGSSLGITTTAEGVETEAQLHALRLEGCTEVQGYLFSPPRPAAEIPRLLAHMSPMLEAA